MLPEKYLLLWLGACTCCARAAALEIRHLSPFGVVPGHRTVLTFSGSGLGKASNLWTSFGATARRITNSDPDVTAFEVSCPETATGVGAIQLFGLDGISNFALVLLDPVRASSGQSEPTENHSLATAHSITVPGTADGVAKSELIDYYALEARAAETYSIEVIAQRLGSQMDPVVSVLDHAGKELIYCDDEGGIWRDTRFRFTAPTEGKYILAVHDVGFGGGNGFSYRLRLTHDPLIWFSFPLIDPFEAGVPVEQLGEGKSNRASASPANPPIATVLSTFPSLAEREPNDRAAEAQSINWPIMINGKIQRPDDIDFFSFNAGKDEKLVFQSQTRSLGSPCDLVLSLCKSDGLVIVQSDSSNSSDAALTNKFSEAGRYLLTVRELSGTAAPDVPYRIKVEEFQPGLEVSSENNRLQASAGGEVTIKVAATRFDFSGPVTLALDPTIEGISLEKGVIPEGKKDGELKLKLSSNMKPGTLFHFRVAARLGINTVTACTVSTAPALKKDFPLMPILPAELDGLFALGVVE
ncbi:MAG TPA: hypothetical protein VGR78_19585 [Verrucomicrobiae bacterium]|jgi:hypothetical protein|nr:hypothetical protein [Verrucomicrobiae bacterium]